MKARAVMYAAAAVAVGAATSTGEARRQDERAFQLANAGHGPQADRAMAGVTELGSVWASAAAAGALAAFGHRRAAVRALSAAGAMWLLGQGLKRAFLRARPYDAMPDTVRLMIRRPQGTSWPSSHPAVLLAFGTVAGHELGLGPGSRGAVVGLAGTVGVSRVYLGVHYPSDVASGLLLGRAVGLVWPSERGTGR